MLILGGSSFVYIKMTENRKNFQCLVRPTCRVRGERVENIRDFMLSQQIRDGEEQCPIETVYWTEVKVSSPAHNVRGYEVAEQFPEACSLCGKKPTPNDFEIK